jgi:hypothetical protein
MSKEEQREWDEIELQRDIAFKIMYFFIAFVFATFGLLYIYFKMHQKAKEDAIAARTGSLDHKLG